MEFFAVAILLNAILAGVVGYTAMQRGRSAVQFFILSFFFSFLVGILVLLAMPAGQNQGLDLRECPKCLAQIPSLAIKCRYCQSDVEPEPQTENKYEVFLHCGKCDTSYDLDEVQGNKCPRCRKSMDLFKS